MTRALAAPPIVVPASMGRLTDVGLDLADGIGFNAWLQLGEQLDQVDDRIVWARADWIAYGERSYRREYGDALERIYARKTLRNIGSIARRVEMSRRRDDLSFSHHAEVAALPPHLQIVWLEDAVRHGWSHKELREQIAAANGQRRMQPALTVKAIGETYDLCVRAARAIDMDPGEFARQAIEDRAREVLARGAA